MDIKEIRGKDSRELELDLQALRKEAFSMRFRGASEEVANTSRFGAIRRTIARINTVLGERRRAGATSAAQTESGQS